MTTKNWSTIGSCAPRLVHGVRLTLPLRNRFRWNGTNALPQPPVSAQVVPVLRGTTSPARLPTIDGKCVLGSYLSSEAELVVDDVIPLTLAVLDKGNQHEFEYSLPLDRQVDQHVGVVCLSGAIASMVDKLERVLVPCGRGGVALPEQFSTTSHTCTAHGFSVTTDIYEYEPKEGDMATLLHAFTFRVAERWYAAVGLRHEVGVECNAWVQVLCWRHGTFEVGGRIYSVDRASGEWLKP